MSSEDNKTSVNPKPTTSGITPANTSSNTKKEEKLFSIKDFVDQRAYSAVDRAAMCVKYKRLGKNTMESWIKLVRKDFNI